MLNIEKIPREIVDDLKKRGHTEEAIAEMTPAEAFDEYCMWHGLMGWGKSLWDAVFALDAATASPEAEVRT